MISGGKLKMRAWYTQKKIMLKVSEINFVKKRIKAMHDGTVYSLRFDEVDLMPSLGIADWKGTTVYDGDIVQAYYGEDFMGVSEYTELFTVHSADLTSLSMIRDASAFEVMGNFYQNKKHI